MLRPILAPAALALIGGCFSPDPPDLRSGHAPRKIPAIKQAVHADNELAIPQLIVDLESDDPAVRFYAIEGLHRLTGQTLGYLYYDDAPVRQEAVMRWRQWIEEKQR